MVARKNEVVKDQAPEQGPLTYETPWKLLAAFGALLLFLVIYGFVN